MKGVTEIGGCHLTLIDILAVTLVDDYAVGDFHDAALDALQLIASTSQLDEQEEIDHRMTSGLGLPYSYGLNKYLVEPCSLTKYNGFTRLTSHAAQRTSRWTGTYEGIGMNGEFLHTCLITQDGTL